MQTPAFEWQPKRSLGTRTPHGARSPPWQPRQEPATLLLRLVFSKMAPGAFWDPRVLVCVCMGGVRVPAEHWGQELRSLQEPLIIRLNRRQKSVRKENSKLISFKLISSSILGSDWR